MSSAEPRVFFPQHRINQWVVDGALDIGPTELTILHYARVYAIEEAVFVKQEVTTGICPSDMIGRVFTRVQLLARNAEVMEESMIVGDHAYDLVAGWVGRPTTDFVTHMEGPGRGKTVNGESPSSEEALLFSALGSASASMAPCA
jgi:hypothetical protein